ncbi:MAG: hypothetical protein JKX91_02285 [Rhizobiaceae bacterium]|nr:hypothetical protein [Rhizobiaceae bacterium]
MSHSKSKSDTPFLPGLIIKIAGLSLLASLVLSYSVKTYANCEDGNTVCENASFVDNGSTVTRAFDLNFRSSGQSLWAPADALGTTFHTNLINSNNARFDASLHVGKIEEFCLYDELSSLLSGISIFGYSFGDVKDWFKDEWSNKCYSYGARYNADLGAYFGMDAQIDFTGGEVEVELPVSVSIEYPSALTYEPGDSITINTSIAANSGASLYTTTPAMTTTPTVYGGANGVSSARGCVDYCQNSGDLYNFDHDFSGSVELPTPRLYLDSTTLSPDNFLQYLLAMDGVIGMPGITTNLSGQDGLALSANGEDTFVDLVIDVDAWVARLAGKPNLFEGGTVYLGTQSTKAKVGYSLINTDATVKSTMSQQTKFTPVIYLEINLSETVGYAVLRSGSSVGSGTSNSIVLRAGDQLVLNLPENLNANIEVSSRVYQQNTFSTSFTETQNSHMSASGLSASMSTPSYTIFNSRCIDLYLGKICTPKLRWPSWSFNAGPAFDESNLAPVDYSYPLYEPEPWELQGFQSFSLAAITLEPQLNTDPEIFVPDDISIEGNSFGGVSSSDADVIAYLDSATATDVEDGDLPVTYSDLPLLLEVNNSYSVDFTTVDSYGAIATGSASISIIDTIAPALEVADLTVVAETPTGTFVPDDNSTIIDWLESATGLDITDVQPLVINDAPSFLGLGINLITFTATDSSGNETTVEVELDIKAPFVMYAENSIQMGRNSVVESGFVAIPSPTIGPWLNNKAQFDLDKNGSLVTGTQLYSDSIYLSKSALVSEAHYSYLSGKGSVTNEGPYVPGIYYPVDSLPAFITGSEDIRVGCKQSSCLPPGSLLEAGDYAELRIDQNNRQSNILYLSGGTYTFASIKLGKNAELRFLEPTLILVRNRVDTDKQVYIGPDDLSSQSASDVIIMVDGIDSMKGRSGKSNKSDKSGKSGKSDKSGKSGKSSKNLKIKQAAVNIDAASHVQANIFAPNGSIVVERYSTITGALSAENIDIAKDVVIRFDGGL